MPLFDTDVQELKNKVLRSVAELAFDGRLVPEELLGVAERIIPDGKPKMRCCIYKERAIINQRVRLALGGDSHTRNMVEVLPVAATSARWRASWSRRPAAAASPTAARTPVR